MTSHPEWQFVIDAAAHASGLPAEQVMAGGKPIKGNEHSRSLHATRQALWTFLGRVGWSPTTIGKWFERDRSSVSKAIIAAEAGVKAKTWPDCQIGQDVWRALFAFLQTRDGVLPQPPQHAPRKRGPAKKPRWQPKDDAPPLAIETLPKDYVLRVTVEVGGVQNERHYCITPAANGRVLPSRRPLPSELLDGLFRERRRHGPSYFKPVKLPDYMGGAGIIPTDESAWLRAGGTI